MLTKALIRKPGKNFAQGITEAELGKPDFARAVEQHQAYRSALEQSGVEVIQLEANADYPDGCFVEDTAIVTEKVVVITRPGADSRQGEEKEIASLLSGHLELARIEAPGTVEGGDILRVENHFYIGQSRRTNLEGARQLSRILGAYGYTTSLLPVDSLLHLKTGVTYLGDSHFIAVEPFCDLFPGGNIISLGAEEAYAANCLRVNGQILLPKGFRRVKQQIQALGYSCIEVEMSEFEKMDGGLTCLSLLW